jgi:hypothetical protein
MVLTKSRDENSDAKFLVSHWGVIADYGMGLPTISPIQSGTKNLVSEKDR